MALRHALFYALAASLFASTVSDSYIHDVEKWRHEREARLKSDTGWLTVAGLFWLKDGANSVGAGPGNDIELQERAAPASVGVFRFDGGHTEFELASGAPVMVDGHPAARTTALRSDTEEGGPDEVTVNALTMFVIHRGDKYAIRLRDKKSGYRKNFTGLHWYPIDPAYRVTAHFTPYPAAQTIPIANILGQTEATPTPGYVEFTLGGQNLKMDAMTENETLFFVFRDQTAGKTTYGAGRMLNTDMPAGGAVTLDFNKAYNPPCAYTPYATCPLPPAQNRLPVAIEAGEKNYGNH